MKNIKYIIPIAVVLILSTLWIIGYQRSKNYQFNGRVDHINYNEKGSPTVVINNVEYFLGFNAWDFTKCRIEVGDKMVKKAGEFNLTVQKENSDKVIDLYAK